MKSMNKTVLLFASLLVVILLIGASAPTTDTKYSNNIDIERIKELPELALENDLFSKDNFYIGLTEDVERVSSIEKANVIVAYDFNLLIDYILVSVESGYLSIDGNAELTKELLIAGSERYERVITYYPERNVDADITQDALICNFYLEGGMVQSVEKPIALIGEQSEAGRLINEFMLDRG